MRRWKLWLVVLGLVVTTTGVNVVICGAGARNAATDQAAVAATPGSAVALEDAIVAAAEEALDSVVSIKIQIPMETMMGGMQHGPFGSPFGSPFDEFFEWSPDAVPEESEPDEEIRRTLPAQGSGVIHSSDGYIITNNHVVEDAVEIRVILRDSRSFDAEVVGTDPESDLAVLKIDADGLTPMRYADMAGVRPGQFAVAVGMPMGLDYSVTVGHVSAVGRGGVFPAELMYQRGLEGQARMSIQNFIQTDAAINQGNSGGPLVNLAGEVMGINSIVAGGVGGGFGFAIPSDIVMKVASDITLSGSVSRAWLGVSMANLTYEMAQALEVERAQGAVVEEVFPGSPAAGAGLQRGDVIVAVDGTAVRNSTDVVYRVSGHSAGERVGITYVRKGKEKQVDVETGERREGLASSMDEQAEEEPAEAVASSEGAKYGMLLSSVSAADNKALERPADAQGVIVREVVPASAAHRAGLLEGDVITDIDGKAVESPEAVAKALKKAKKEYVPLTVERAGRLQFVALKKLTDEE